MTDLIGEFKDVLDQVPQVLLGMEDARILTDARTSADVLESLASSQVSVVLVGCTGVGKSHLLNSLTGTEASKTGVLRPTTTASVMAGSSERSDVDHASEYVHAPGLPGGMSIMDTPAWETDTDAVRSALAGADVGVLVVSPARYGDATTRDLWDSMQAVPTTMVVLNRQRGLPSERVEILDSVQERFAPAEVLVVDESGDSSDLLRRITEVTSELAPAQDKTSIARAAAATAGRHIAGVVTAGAINMGRLESDVESVVRPEFTGRDLDVGESWLATEQVLVADARRLIDELDRMISGSAEKDLARRLLESLGRWQSSPLEADLTQWRDEAANRFRREAKIRWRRSATEQMLDHASWKVGVNSAVHVAKRVRRVMGSNLETATRQIYDALVGTIDGQVEERLDAWRTAIDVCGSFKPGELLAASEEIANG